MNSQRLFRVVSLIQWYAVIADYAHSLRSEVQETLQTRWMKSLLSFVQSTTERSSESQSDTVPSVLPRGLLETNLGIPAMVVCTHTDVIVSFLAHVTRRPNQKHSLRSKWTSFNMHFVVIVCFVSSSFSLHVDGSSLVYLNTAARTNLSIATNHILSILFPGMFVSPPPNVSFHLLFERSLRHKMKCLSPREVIITISLQIY